MMITVAMITIADDEFVFQTIITDEDKSIIDIKVPIRYYLAPAEKMKKSTIL